MILKIIISEPILKIKFMRTFHKIALKLMPQDTINIDSGNGLMPSGYQYLCPHMVLLGHNELNC